MKTPEPANPERSVQRRDAVADLASEAIDASVGALAGTAVGVLAGPVGMIAGAAIGAVAGGLLARQAEHEQHEAALRDRELDAIDAEEEFFGRSDALSSPPGPMEEAADEGANFATTIMLRADHQRILERLDALLAWASRIEREQDWDARTDGRELSTFFSTFAEAEHAEREEQILFDAIERNLTARERAPLPIMIEEHLLLEGLRLELTSLIGTAEPWSREDRARAADVAGRYSDLFRRHMSKEELVLFPMAEARLSARVKAEVDARFQTFVPEDPA